MKLNILTEAKTGRITVNIPEDATFGDYMRVIKFIKLQMKTRVHHEKAEA